ncbi:MAG: ROK family protein [Actinomycetota bacterium]
MTLYGAVEMGGTKTDVTVGTSLDDLAEPTRIPTTDPDGTLQRICRYFEDHDVSAVGVASFGPLELDRRSSRYGQMLTTPKPGWTGAQVYQQLADGIGAPIFLDTDVNGSALGEGRWGAAQGMSYYVYVTVGTGVGAGVVIAGETISGGTGHPEVGHIVVSRHPDETHEGSCPYHGDCLEGMAAGPSLEARFGRPETWAGNEKVTEFAVHYLAQGMVNLHYTVTPERIVVGGGVSKLPGFHERLRIRAKTLIAGYPKTPDMDLLIAPPGLGDRSGLAGALILAASADGG